jgi:hypothetical protein
MKGEYAFMLAILLKGEATIMLYPGNKTVMRYTRSVRRLITGLSNALVLIFASIQLRNFPVDIIFNSTTPVVLWHIGLGVYFASWIYGTKFDVDVQELVYDEFPSQGKMPVHGLVVILLLAVGAIILLWTQEHIQRFAIAISIFFVVDHLAWLYVIRFVKPIVTSSRKKYKEELKNYFLLEALEVVSYQIQGNLKLWRLTGGIPLVILINAFAFSNTVQSYITSITMSLLPQFSINDANAFIAGVLVVCFVAFMEIWSWSLRIKTKVSLGFINKVSVKYDLFSKTPSQ